MASSKFLDFRTGITLRLALGFAVVGLLAATANLVAERGATLVSDAWRQPTIDRFEPIASAPLSARPVQAAAPAAQQSERVDPDALKAAVADFERASLAGVVLAKDAPAVDLLSARERLMQAGTHFDVVAAGQASPQVRQGILQAVSEVERQGTRAVMSAERRRAYASAYLQRLSQMKARIDETLSRAVTLFGRVIARQYLIELRNAIGNLQVPGGKLAGAEYGPGDLAAVAQAESVIGALLQTHGERLSRSQGKEWMEAMNADLDALASDRESIADAEIARAQAVDQLRLAAAQVDRRIAAWQRSLANARAAPPSIAALPPALAKSTPIAQPAAVAVRKAQVEAAEAQSRRLRQLIFWFTVALIVVSLAISIGTVRSIVRPVRDLLRATARVAAGEKQVQVPRGGARELDTLAAAFNTMAAEVESARREAERYRQELEQRVDERTRQLQYQASHDPLTKLPNRQQFFDLLRSALAAASRKGSIVAVYFVDLDNFKHVNDGTGHEFGDRLLVACAERLRETVAGRGVAARFGGDEFTIVAAGIADEHAAQTLGESLVAAFQRPVIVDQREVLVGVSVGAALYPAHHDTPEALLRAADTALYRAKQQGRNRFSAYTPELLAQASVRFSTEQQLRRALEAGELVLVYQPEVRSDGFEVQMVEALLRWRRADGSIVMPDVFLPVAEESGLIMEISDWAYQRAMADCAAWRRAGWANACVAVNVSPRQLFDNRFATRVLETLVEHGLPPEAVELELTETVLQTGAATIAALRRLRELGLTIALDDFGTGYSSLSSLDQLPINRVKLDRSLIADVDGNPRAAAIVSATLQLCRDLGLQVTAEGIERPQQFAAMLRHQPLLLQGFLLARPVEASHVLDMVRRLPQAAEGFLLETAATPAPVINLFPSARQRSK